MELGSVKGHSEEFFGDYRDFWWNRDFIGLLAQRWGLSSASSVLDVGCGRCHWSLLLAPHLQKPACITAVDRDPKWSAGHPDISKRFQDLDLSVRFMPADAHALPFADDQFDVATCQTMLIHCIDPETALREMRRVVKPGGIVICAEPNNLVGAASFDSVEEKTSVDVLVDNFHQRLLYERGRQAAGDGNMSIGDKLAYLFSRNGFEGIQAYISDRVNPLYPPYVRPEQKAEIAQALEFRTHPKADSQHREHNSYVSSLDNADAPALTDRHQKQKALYLEKFSTALGDQTFFSSGLCVMYAVSGRKKHELSTYYL